MPWMCTITLLISIIINIIIITIVVSISKYHSAKRQLHFQRYRVGSIEVETVEMSTTTNSRLSTS